MTAAQITELRQAEDSSTAAQERLAHLESANRSIFEAMVSAGIARARELLSDEDMRLFGFEGLSEVTAKAASLGMDDLVIAASDEAGAASMFLHDLECEIADGGLIYGVADLPMAAE